MTTIAFLAALSAPPAQAEVRAVLVGVGDYATLDADLKGPPADVALMATTLVARGVPAAAITALTTDPAAGQMPAGLRLGPPTRAAILGALDAAGAASAPGDTVLFYFSGHGSQAPDQDGDEAGGYDEILLPADAGGWKGAVGEVENAIRDDELQAWARGLTGRGVRLVGVIDACHSGTGFRALGAAGRARQVDPGALGIPDAPATASASAPHTTPLTGDFVFLYSSQADQRSFEFPLDPAAPDGPWHGAFTLALARALTDAPDATWGQVLAATRARMTIGAVRQDPDGEGPALDAPVFGTGTVPGRLPLAAGMVEAGLLDGVAQGATLAFFDAAGAELSRATVTEAKAAVAQVAGGPPPGAAWAEIVAPAPPPPLRMASPVRADAGDYGAWETALADAIADGLAQASAEADLVPILAGGTLALAGADGALDPEGLGSTPRVTPRAGETATAATFRTLEAAAHALRLRGVIAGLAGRSFGARGGPDVTIERRPGRVEGATCARPGPAQPFADGQTAAPCDELWLTIENRGATAQDVTVLYLAQDFTLTPIWPVGSLSNRLLLGEAARVGLRIAPDSGLNAREEIWVVSVAADLAAGRTSLVSLATPDRLRAAPDNLAGGAIAALMEPDTTARGFTAARPPLTFLRQSLRIADAPAP